MNAETSKNLIAFVAYLLVMVALVLIGYQAVRSWSNTVELMGTHNSLHWIGMALHQYHDDYGSFPPVVTHDRNGMPRHSWRGLVEPYMAESVPEYRSGPAYQLDENWDSPANRRTPVSQGYDNQRFKIYAVVGPHAAWSYDGPRKISDFTDGAAHTVLCIAIQDSGMAWHQPGDVDFNGNTLMLADAEIDLSRDFFVLMADGAVRYSKNWTPFEKFVPLLTIDAGDTFPTEY